MSAHVNHQDEKPLVPLSGIQSLSASDVLNALTKAKIVSEEQLEYLLNTHQHDILSVIHELKDTYPIHKETLGRIWADRLGYAYVDMDRTTIQSEVSDQVPMEIALAYNALPIYQVSGVLTIASSLPGNPELEQKLENLGVFASFVFSYRDEIEARLKTIYESREIMRFVIQDQDLDSAGKKMLTIEGLRGLSGDDYIIQLSRSILIFAINEHASDIHIEPEDHSVRIRFRIDGRLQNRFFLEKAIHTPLISRFKILANVDIAEHRKPQDGRMRFEIGHTTTDLRFSSVPTIYGEKIVMRILGQMSSSGIPDLTELNLSHSVYSDIERICKSSHGLFLVTGPTGSGKTTTLYSILKRVNSPEVNIVTVEDPVEYRLANLNQVQVNPAADVTFVTALRAFLRQDPDIMLIGEIRDLESARIATQASITGHMVFATLHTNSCLQAVTRLIDMGVEPHMVGPSLVGVMAQRLIRKLCPHCKEAYQAPESFLQENFTDSAGETLKLYKAKGCRQCNHTGFLGRIAIHEAFLITAEVRQLISKNATLVEIEEASRKAGFKSLRYDALKKLIRGLTTVEEIDRVTFSV